MTAFIFTWKPEHWPYEKLTDLVLKHSEGEQVIEPWRCAAYRQVKLGDRGYLFRQGSRDRGIFGIATICGEPYKNELAKKGEQKWMVPLQFTELIDPTIEFLITEEQLRTFGATDTLFNAQGSGVSINDTVANQIDHFVQKKVDTQNKSPESDKDLNEKTERYYEAFYRDQTLPRYLKELYQSKCQICASVPFNGLLGDVSEAHHIEWLCRGGQDTIDNMILLCPNHHAAIHASDPIWDKESEEFIFPNRKLPIRLNLHLGKVNVET